MLFSLYRWCAFHPLPAPCMQALPLAIAAVRDTRGHSFPEAAELLLDVLEHGDNSGGAYDDDNALAALLEALGQLRLSSPEVATSPPGRDCHSLACMQAAQLEVSVTPQNAP